MGDVLRKWLLAVLISMLGADIGLLPVMAKGYSVLHEFQGTDGAHPKGTLIRDADGNLYGTTLGITNSTFGNIFKLAPDGSMTVLYSFGGADGAEPWAGLLRDDKGNLYGTTNQGGDAGKGTAFKLSPQGTLKTLHSFAGGRDGANPFGDLISDDARNLFGTASHGGKRDLGTVFKINRKGRETALHKFNGADGAHPLAGLIRDDAANLYGTTNEGGDFGLGTVFRIAANGTFTVLHSFGGTGDGAYPEAKLTLDNSGNLYGTTYEGGSSNEGTVFKVAPDGSELVLHAFGSPSGGYNPSGGQLFLDPQGDIYGVAEAGGDDSYGAVFKLTPDGAETVLYSFKGNGDGSCPYGGLITDGEGLLYGTTYTCSTSYYGTVFQIHE